MILAVISPRRIVAKRVLAPKFLRDDVEDFFDLTASPDESFGQQECAAAAVFRKCPQNTHVDLIAALVLDAGLSPDQTRQRPAPCIPVRTFRVSKWRDADWVNNQVRYANPLENVIKSGHTSGVLSVGNEKDRTFCMMAGRDLRDTLCHCIVKSGAACRNDSPQRL